MRTPYCWSPHCALGLVLAAGAAVASFAAWADEPVKSEPPPAPKAVPALKLVPAAAVSATAPFAAVPEAKPAATTPTHEQVRTIAVKGQWGGISLQTLCANDEGQVVALVAPSRYGQPQTPAKVVSEVQVFSADGKEVRKWPVNFKAQSINAGPGGLVYVAGDGRLAKFDKEGKLVTEVEVPHLAKLLTDTAALKKQAAEQLKSEIASFDEMAKAMQEQKKQVTTKEPKDQTPNEKNQLRAIEFQIKQYEEIAAQYKKRTVDDVVGDLTSRMRIINAITATDTDVFIACGEAKGYGYSVWRMDTEFKSPKQIITGLGGCCGQMDVQAHGSELFVAENTKHKVGKFDREGKRLASFGKRGKEGDAECFGGCCNPMNVHCCSDGSVFTAESEGFVKQYDSKGELIGPVGTAKLQGGCKNVAVAATADGKTVYFCDQPGSRILVLAKKDAAK